MDWFKRKFIKEFEEMEIRMGRMMRTMSISGQAPFQSGRWFPATDICETPKEIVVYMDVSGIDPDRLKVEADEIRVTVSGKRSLPDFGTEFIHQLEIERGFVEWSIAWPVPVDISSLKYFCENGFVIIRIRKIKKRTVTVVKIS